MTVNQPKPYHNVFFTHQPVFKTNRKVWCYELYFRDKINACAVLFSDEDKLQATMEVLANIALCPDKKFDRTKVIINFPTQAIINQVFQSLHPESTIIQITDTPDFSTSIIQEIKQLKGTGYMFSIDNYKANPDNLDIYRMSDFITLSVIDHSKSEIRSLLRTFPDLKTSFIAKNIETQVQFLQAKNQGFSLFQGHFFKLPKTGAVRKISSHEMLRLDILEKLCNPDLDFDTLKSIIAKDASLSLRLITLLNSPAYGLQTKVSSLKQALVYVGLNQLKQWLRVILFTDMEQPHATKELMRTSLQRAKFLENISSQLGSENDPHRLFLLGLFSLLDTILQIPMEKVISYLSALDEQISQTLLRENTDLFNWLLLIENMENSDWDKVGTLLATLHLGSAEVMDSYVTAVKWANEALVGSS